MPVVSVVIPAYNAERFLHHAIESALAQDLGDLEIIVVDDGSSDGTAALAASYPTVRVLRQANAGASAARNHAVREAQGEFIAFLDADDRWHPDKLRSQVQAMRRHPQAVLSRCRVTHDLAEFEALVRARQPGQEWPVRLVETLDESFLYPFFGTPAVMVRRSDFVRIGGFDESLRVSEDVDFYLRLLVDQPQVAVIEHPLLFVDLHDEGLSADGVGGYRQLIEVYQRLIRSRPERFETQGPLVHKALGRLELRLARSLLRRGDALPALGAAWRSMRHEPSLGPVIVAVRAALPHSVLAAVSRLRKARSA